MTLAGCSDPADIRPGDVRSYRVPRTVAPEARPAGRPGPAAPPAPALRYDVPAGWADRGGGGMRLATLVIGDPTAGREVTVIPAAGTLAGNVARWIGQLDAQSDDAAKERAAAAALETAQRVDVDGAQASVVLLLDAAARAGDDGGQAILGAMIPVERSTALFVKFKGDATVARRERDNFVRFVSSIRWTDRSEP